MIVVDEFSENVQLNDSADLVGCGTAMKSSLL